MEKGRIEFDDPNFRARSLASLLRVGLMTDDDGHTTLLDNQPQFLKERYRRVRSLQDNHALPNVEAAVCDLIAAARKDGHTDDVILTAITAALNELSVEVLNGNEVHT